MSQLPSTPDSVSPRVTSASADDPRNAVSSQPIGVELLEIETQPLIRDVARAVDAAGTADELFKALFEIIAVQTECLALWRVQVAAADKTLRTSAVSDDSAAAVWLSVEDQITDVVQKSESYDQICSALVLPDREHVLVAAPLEAGLSQDDSREILTACFAANDQSTLRLQWMLGIVSQSVSQWAQRRQLVLVKSQSQTLNEALQLLNEISDSKNTTEAAIAIVNNFRRLFDANQVAIAQVDVHQRSHLLAVSDVENLDAAATNNKRLLSAIDQSVSSRASVAFPNQDAQIAAARVLPLENWCADANAASAISLPMKVDGDEIVGALLVTFADRDRINQQPYVEKMAALVAKQFYIVSRATCSTGELLRLKLRKGKSTMRKLCIAALIVVGLMAVPMPYRVPCECQLQPIERRFVAAPYDGILEKSFVKIGDVVSQDQIIARLDGRQLRIELAGLEAQYEGAKRRRDSSLAVREIAQSQIARSEMNRFWSQIQLLNNRMKDLETRSPIGGVIVAGDMEKAQGAPLEMGQNLFEVAPLETMVAEIGIPESEIHYVHQGDAVALKINAFPYQSWAGKVQQIHPSAEIVDDQTVFIAEVEIDNSAGDLRPGMEGNAKITTRWSPIGWNLFHGAWESLRYWTIW